ncbi:MAG: YggS family pyridoxal phosphate-dependent enzyme [Thermosipho sp. (in: Bacteria)]|nr:YggS family pyridoxal phosphate-dependent enzyme [Thermosipho sp. (in: thermotogales)]
MSKIFENYQRVIENIKEVCEKSGRDFSEIKVVAVSKTFPEDIIEEAFQNGIKIFGENYAQEFRRKAEHFNGRDIEWHYIGRIQTNKLKYIVPYAKLIHSVTRVEEVRKIDELSKKFGKTQDILVQMNLSGEVTKAGLKKDEINDFLNSISKYNNVKVIGLMTMAPFTSDESIIRKVFSELRKIRDELSKNYPEIKHLSMGMSNDYLIAVEEGATILRIGSAIFGEREYN